MAADKKLQHFTTGRRYLEELRKRRARPHVTESINKSRTMVIINLVIEIATGIILLVGISYLIRFFMMKQHSIDPLVYRLSLSCIAVFTFGWLTYLFMKIRSHILKLRKNDKKTRHSRLSDN